MTLRKIRGKNDLFVFFFYSVIASGGCGCGYIGACETPGRAQEPLSGEYKSMIIMLKWFDDMIDDKRDAVDAGILVSPVKLIV
jgi:hypothetical protein